MKNIFWPIITAIALIFMICFIGYMIRQDFNDIEKAHRFQIKCYQERIHELETKLYEKDIK